MSWDVTIGWGLGWSLDVSPMCVYVVTLGFCVRRGAGLLLTRGLGCWVLVSVVPSALSSLLGLGLEARLALWKGLWSLGQFT